MEKHTKLKLPLRKSGERVQMKNGVDLGHIIWRADSGHISSRANVKRRETGPQDRYTKGDWTTRQLIRRETGPQNRDRWETGPQYHYTKEGRLGQTTVTKRETGPQDSYIREGRLDHMTVT